MSEYRDIGSLWPDGKQEAYPRSDKSVDTIKRGQVYQATHIGENSLPYMNRSFISFTYGEKKIEDFDLIATISGNRLNRKGYSQFNDTVSTYDNLDGQHYWATHYKNNQLDLTLSTDGIDQKKLDSFLHWFKAGISRELVLAEHPNRAIMARVSQPPVLNLLPFEHDVTITLVGDEYKTKTTLYKGDIQLSLVMDKPHWYSKVNILGKVVQKNETSYTYDNTWVDANDQTVSVFASKDALKILYEDGIPLGGMIDNNMLLGNGAYANVENKPEGRIWDPVQTGEGHPLGTARINGTITNTDYLTNSSAISTEALLALTTEENEELHYDIDSELNSFIDYPPGNYIGVIAGAIVTANDEGITQLSPNVNAYFFYAGTAPSPTLISFDLTVSFDNGYISVPSNSYAKTGTTDPYNIFIIESLNKQVLRFTTPNIFTSYNKAVNIFKTMITENNSWEKIREAVRDQVRHAKVRAWAIKLIDDSATNNGNAVAITAGNSSTLSNTLITGMRSFIDNGSTIIAHFSFNSETGEALGTFSYRNTDNNFVTNQVEDVGDMLKSNYIIIQDRNYPTSSGHIVAWRDSSDETRQYSHRIQHDVYGGLEKIQILYKNMYL